MHLGDVRPKVAVGVLAVVKQALVRAFELVHLFERFLKGVVLLHHLPSSLLQPRLCTIRGLNRFVDSGLHRLERCLGPRAGVVHALVHVNRHRLLEPRDHEAEEPTSPCAIALIACWSRLDIGSEPSFAAMHSGCDMCWRGARFCATRQYLSQMARGRVVHSQ